MTSYNVDQISKLLNANPETVRRWIRTGKLIAEKSSRKGGNIVSDKSLGLFLDSYPKYASIVSEAVGSSLITPILGVAAGIATTAIASQLMNNEKEDNKNSAHEINKQLKAEIDNLQQSINQKLSIINQLQREISEQQQHLQLLVNELKKEDE